MTERFTRVFTLPEELYTPGSPLLIQAGALLKDRETGRVIAQLKLKNISTETAQAVRVRIWPVDAMGRAAPRPLESMYLDLAAPRGREFGTKVPIPMPDPTTRSFRAEIGAKVMPEKSPWSLDLNLSGFAGKKQGVMGGISIAWLF